MIDVFDGVDNDALMIDDCNGASISTLPAYGSQLCGPALLH